MSQGNVTVSAGRRARRGRRVRPRDIIVTLGIALLVVGIFFAFNRSGGPEEGAFVRFSPFTGRLPSGPAPMVGNPAPDFQVGLLDGGSFRLSEQRGRVVWLNFWATWCPPCRAEMPDIEKVWQDEQGTDLVLVAVNFAESPETVRAFLQRLGLTFPIGMDTTGQVTADYRVAGFPSHFLVDRNGILRDIRVGLMSEETMREKLRRLRSY